MKKWSIFIICFMLFGFYVDFIWIVKPLISELMEERRKRVSIEEEMRLKQAILQNSQKIQQRWENYATYFRQDLNNEEGLSGMLSRIEIAANSAHLSLEDRKPRQIKAGDLYNTYAIELTFEGDMKSLVEFLYSIQNEPNFLDVDELRLEKRSYQDPVLKCYLVVSRVMFSS